MKNLIDHCSLNFNPGVFSLDKFIESDDPGTLSWLNMEADDRNNDSLPFKEVELNSVTPPCASTKLGNGCQLQCAWCRNNLEKNKPVKDHEKRF